MAPRPAREDKSTSAVAPAEEPASQVPVIPGPAEGRSPESMTADVAISTVPWSWIPDSFATLSFRNDDRRSYPTAATFSRACQKRITRCAE